MNLVVFLKGVGKAQLASLCDNGLLLSFENRKKVMGIKFTPDGGRVVVRLARSKQDWGGRLVWISRDGQVQESQRSPLGQKETDTLALNWSRLVRRLVLAGDGKPGPTTDGLCLPAPQTRREAR